MVREALAVRNALESGDAVELSRLTGVKGKDRHDLLKILHMARTQAASVSLAKRQYSHTWLVERGLPSMLPDADHPPRVVEAVGIAVVSMVPAVKVAIHDAMRNAVLTAYGDGETDPNRIRTLMYEARDRERAGLELVRDERAKG